MRDDYPGCYIRNHAHAEVLTGSVADAHATTSPGYVLMGGGKDVDSTFQWLIRKSGGGDIVVIRASGADGYNPYINGLGRVDSVESLLIATPEAARDPFMLERIREAEALFIAGGDQWNYVRVWGAAAGASRGAGADRSRRAGGRISAGLAVPGQFVFTAEKDTVTSDQAPANPYHERVTVGGEFVHIPALASVITDSHFVKRDRMGRAGRACEGRARDRGGRAYCRVGGAGRTGDDRRRRACRAGVR